MVPPRKLQHRLLRQRFIIVIVDVLRKNMCHVVCVLVNSLATNIWRSKTVTNSPTCFELGLAFRMGLIFRHLVFKMLSSHLKHDESFVYWANSIHRTLFMFCKNFIAYSHLCNLFSCSKTIETSLAMMVVFLGILRFAVQPNDEVVECSWILSLSVFRLYNMQIQTEVISCWESLWCNRC